MNLRSPQNFILLFLGATLLIGFGLGFYAGKIHGYVAPIEGVTNLDVGQPTGVDFSLFWDAWRVAQEKFVDSDNLDFQGMVHGAIQGMIESLGDPYTVFMTPDDTKIFLEDIAGSFGGVGMEIGIRKGQLQVIAPLEGTPAEKAGLRAGDHIVRIGDDVFTRDISIDKAVSLIRGPEGTNITLLVFREGWSEPREFEIERAIINIPSLRWEILEDNVAYIKLFQFSEKARTDFQKVGRDIQSSSADRIILDLRNNPGGFLEVSVDIAGWFLKRGDIVVIEDFGMEGKQEIYSARGNARFLEYPIVVLINEGSASASEILAGALRDNRGVQLIGQKSFGKGSVQELENLDDGSSLKLTVANWLTPNGDLITDRGLEPDVEVEITEEDVAAEKDPQLQEALEVIRAL